MSEGTNEAGKGCAYLLLAILVLGMLLATPALLGVGELAKQHRLETEQRVGR